MLVFWDQRLVFLATPKTGSTALATALEPLAAMSLQRPPVMKHTTIQRYHRFLGPWLKIAAGEEFTTVALMREPVDWLGSWFRFRRREDLTDARNSTRAMDFDAFANAYCERPQPDFANVGSQARFLSPEGRQPVDRIFCYEQIGSFTDFLGERLGRKIELPRVNVSPAADLTLQPGTRARLAQTIAADFALYERIARG